jgi:hypothetical protein
MAALNPSSLPLVFETHHDETCSGLLCGLPAEALQFCDSAILVWAYPFSFSVRRSICRVPPLLAGNSAVRCDCIIIPRINTRSGLNMHGNYPCINDTQHTALSIRTHWLMP